MFKNIMSVLKIDFLETRPFLRQASLGFVQENKYQLDKNIQKVS